VGRRRPFRVRHGQGHMGQCRPPHARGHPEVRHGARSDHRELM